VAGFLHQVVENFSDVSIHVTTIRVPSELQVELAGQRQRRICNRVVKVLPRRPSADLMRKIYGASPSVRLIVRYRGVGTNFGTRLLGNRLQTRSVALGSTTLKLPQN
jgi:hypothetical protein